jgi:transposase
LDPFDCFDCTIGRFTPRPNTVGGGNRQNDPYTLASEPAAKRLQGIPGISPTIATAALCAVGDGKQFKRGRDMAAWPPLTPRQHSSGGKDRLLGMGKRGDTYLRALLVQGAKSVFDVAGKNTDPRSLWLKTLCGRRHKNMAVVALANKNAKVAWALLSNETDCLPGGGKLV